MKNPYLNAQAVRASNAVAMTKAALTLILIWAVCIVPTLVRAQNPEVGGPESYQPEKTVADYTKGSQAAKTTDFDYASNTLRVEVWVDKSQDEVYGKGEKMSVGVQTNQDAYAVVYRIDTEGVVTVLWPRSRFDDGFIFGGHEYGLPVSGAPRLRVSDLPGEGVVEAIVSQYPFDLRALELDFHHEPAAEQYNFQVAGDPFLAINEVNFAVTGLEDAGEYVVTNYVSYYVHQQVDHPRYLCAQCHLDDDVTYDPYQDNCALDIEYDYSWYNKWYDSYGYYPVYGNPVYVYVDPWSLNPWVNYWYRPYYTCAPWYGWGWGWGSCYSWGSSPYYWGDSSVAYSRGYTRYRPLDRSRLGRADGSVIKTREYTRGSAMVRQSRLSDRDRSAMQTRSRGSESNRTQLAVGGRSRGPNTSYRGAPAEVRSRTRFDRVATGSQSRGGLRIRETGHARATTGRGGKETVSRRHTAGGDGQRAGLIPVNPGQSRGVGDWRGTTRVGGGTSVGNSGRANSGNNQNSPRAANNRTRGTAGGKAVQPRQRSTRVWTAPRERGGSSSRSRSSTVNSRSGRQSGHRQQTGIQQNKQTRKNSQGSRSGTTTKARSGTKNGSKTGGSKASRNQGRGAKSSSARSSRNSSSGRSSGATRSGSSSRGGSRSSGGGRSSASRR